MQRKNYKGRCEKALLEKCNGVCKTYNSISSAYAVILNEREDVKEFTCNTLLDGEDYSTDFVVTKTDGDIITF